MRADYMIVYIPKLQGIKPFEIIVERVIPKPTSLQ
jgi:hypothetical protein